MITFADAEARVAAELPHAFPLDVGHIQDRGASWFFLAGLVGMAFS